MKWCKAMNMWCSDMDEEDVENTGCDGNCNGCDECEDVKFQYRRNINQIWICPESHLTILGQLSNCVQI